MNTGRLSTALSICMLAGCAASKGTEPKTEPAGARPAEALGPVPLLAKSGADVSGSVTMRTVDGKVHVQVSVENTPAGRHGVHVHEKGDCSAPDASSAGGHFNPEGHPHGLPGGGGPRHLGDFGNIDVAGDGTGTLEITVEGANLDEGDPMSFRGRALIVHENPDTGEQPTGGAGGRIACAELR